jgi:hypothetical protein
MVRGKRLQTDASRSAPMSRKRYFRFAIDAGGQRW